MKAAKYILLGILLLMLVLCAAQTAWSAEGCPPFRIRGIKGCYWDGIEKYRLALPWIAKHKMNFLMLCPTSFKASGPDWRTDYTEAEKKEIAELAADARKRKVQVCLGFNPGLWSKPPLEYSSQRDYGIILDRARTAFALGMDWVSLCLDDINVEMLPADKTRFGRLEHAHASLVNRLWNDMKTMNPKARLIFCPSVYCDDAVRSNLDYIKTIGEKVDPEVMVFWTGPQVCSASITAGDARNIAGILCRKPFIWDNYPVNDAFNWGPYMSPLQNRSADLASECAGYIANEMKQWHMSTIALATTAEYLRDPGGYDPKAAIQRVIKSYPASEQRAICLLVDLMAKRSGAKKVFRPGPRPPARRRPAKCFPN